MAAEPEAVGEGNLGVNSPGLSDEGDRSLKRREIWVAFGLGPEAIVSELVIAQAWGETSFHDQQVGENVETARSPQGVTDARLVPCYMWDWLLADGG